MENLNKAAPPILAEGAVFKWSLANPESEDQTQSVDFGVGSLTVAFEAGLHVVCGPTASGKTLMLLGKKTGAPLMI